MFSVKNNLFKSKEKHKSIAAINVVPYLDVMLVLLIIFIIGPPSINQGVQVNLPRTGGKTISIDHNSPIPVIVTVDKDHALFLNLAQNPVNAISAQQLQVEVKAALLLDPHRLVIVRADRDVNYSAVMSAMVLLQQAGAAAVSLETSGIK